MKNYKFYKFSRINKNLVDSLLKGYLFFAKPVNLNDPFDCHLDIQKAVKNVMEMAVQNDNEIGVQRLQILIDHKKTLSSIEKAIHEWGVCSFSFSLNMEKEPLMWSHYAGNHCGACILYEIPEDFLVDESNKILGVDRVKYDKNPLTNLLLDYSNINNEIKDDFDNDIIKTIIMSKNSCWDYEQEVRIIRKESGRLDIPKSYIKKICFGLHTSDEDISLIREIVGSYDHEVNLCRVVSGESDFGIDYDDLLR